MSGIRVDKWLWAARFFKTRTLASDAVDGGKVQLNGNRVKPAKEVKAGDRLAITVGDQRWDIEVLALSDKRGPASQARLLYAEDEASQKRREQAREVRPLTTDPSLERHGRPTKRDRRQLEKLDWS